MGSVVLLSGGIDSAVCAAIEAERGRLLGCLFISYGQPAADCERVAARAIARQLDVPFAQMTVPLPLGSMGAPEGEEGPRVVPGRNLALLSLAICHALSLGADTVVVGATAADRDSYPDCRGPFLRDLSEVVRVTYGAHVEAPLIGCSKAKVVGIAHRLDLDLSWTWSCYTPRAVDAPIGRHELPRLQPCGTCNACVERQAALPREAQCM